MPLSIRRVRSGQMSARMIGVVDPKMAYAIQLTDINGQPITQLSVGQWFYVHILVEDRRDSAQGVYAAFFDLHWNSSLASVAGGVRWLGERRIAPSCRLRNAIQRAS
jgi:hypothetical protein